MTRQILATIRKTQTPDSIAGNAVTMRGQNMTDARAREAMAQSQRQHAETASSVEYKQDAAGNWIALPKKPTHPGAIQPIPVASTPKCANDARNALALVDEAERLVDDATSSYIGAGRDLAGRVVGYATDGAEAGARLQVLEGALVMNHRPPAHARRCPALKGEVRALLESGLKTPSVVHGPMGRRNGGMTIDEMAEAMQQHGYIDEPDARLLLEKLGEEAGGSKAWSVYASDDIRAAAAGAFDDMPEHFMQPESVPGLVPWQTLQNLRSRASETAHKLGQSGDRRAAAAAQQLKEQIDGTLEAAAGRSAMRHSLGAGEDVAGAMHRPGLGEVDFRYGDVGTWNAAKGKFVKGGGVSHIVGNRDVEGRDGLLAALSMPDVIARGKVHRVADSMPGQARANIRLGDAEAVLSEGPRGHWLLTGWNDGLPAGVGREVHPAADYAAGQSFIRDRLGAADTSILGVPPGEYFEPDMARAARDMRRARIDQAQRFETGPAGLLWKDGADGAPRLQGAERIKAFVNAKDTQADDARQLLTMVEPGGRAVRAAKDYAITDLIERSTQRGADADTAALLPAQYGRWMDARGGLLRELFDGRERGLLGAVRDDLNRATRASTLGSDVGVPQRSPNLAAQGGQAFERATAVRKSSSGRAGPCR